MSEIDTIQSSSKHHSRSFEEIIDDLGAKKAIPVIIEKIGLIDKRLGNKEASLRDNRTRAYTIIGDYWNNKGELDSAVFYLETSVKFPYDNVRAHINALNVLSRTYLLDSRYDESFSSALSALELSKDINYNKGLRSSKLRLGQVYMENHEYDKAEKILLQALEATPKGPITKFESVDVLEHLSKLKLMQNDLKQSIYYSKEALQLVRVLEDDYHLVDALNFLGEAYLQDNQIEEAFDTLIEAYQKSSFLEYEVGLVITGINMAKLHRERNEYGEALAYIEKALQLAKEHWTKVDIMACYDIKSSLLNDTGRYEEAYQTRLIFERWKDSMFIEDKLKEVVRLDKKYQSQQRENEILKLEQENLLKESSILKKERLLKMLGGIGLFILLVLSISFFIYRHKVNLNKQREIFKTIVQTEIKEQHRIARDLHDSIGSILASTSGHLSIIETEDEKSAKSLSTSRKMLKDAIEETRRISHNMMPEALVKFGLIVALESLLEDVEASTGIKTEFEHSDIDETMEIGSKLQIYRILQELIQNILKHSKSEVISLKLNQAAEQVTITVEDKGIGFALDEVRSNEGYGLKNIQSRVDYLKGKLTIETKPKKGTKVSLNIPL